jgi:sulfur-carrier protein adenylyltransferase/sulfurtransferase
MTQEDTGFSPEELERYARHLILPGMSVEGQRKLKAASVLVVGAGGLGSAVSIYLAATGIGRLGLVDFDTVNLSNLQRQILHGTGDVGRPKIESARERLAELNPNVRVETWGVELTAQNAPRILADYDVVVDGSDNFPTRYRINDACVRLGKPFVYGAVFEFEGQVSVFDAARGPCYRCLYPEPPSPGLAPAGTPFGVLGVLPGIVGTIQATETLKLLMGVGEPLVGRLLLVESLGMTFRELGLRKDPACSACGH